MFTEQNVIDYYDKSEIHYKMHWKLEKCLAMHYGFKDREHRTFEESLINMNFQLAKRASICETDFVLDAGCGIGGSSIYLANQFKCQVHGITLSEKQVKTANKNALNNDLEKKVEFSKQSFTETSFKDDSFDVVWAIESVCHAFNKKDFYDEAFRILKPGGRLIVADYIEENDIVQEGKQSLKKWLDCWSIKSIPTLSDVNGYLKKFKMSNIEDITKNITNSSRKLYNMYYMGLVFHRIYDFFYKVSPESEANFKSAKYQYQSLKKKYWTYRIITATK